MTATALSARRAHQREVAALLDEIEERRSRLYRLKAAGARRAGLRDILGDLEDAQRRLTQSV